MKFTSPFFILALALFLSACSPSLPPAVSSDLLDKMTTKEADQLEALERSLIDFPDQKTLEKKKRQKLDDALTLAKGEVTAAKDQRTELHSKLEKAKQDKLGPLVKQLQGQVATAEITLKQKKKLKNIQQTEVELQQAVQELLDATIAFKVAEQRMLQAIIGRRIQKLEAGPVTDKKEREELEKSWVNLKQYQEYLTYQQKTFSEKKVQFQRAKANLYKIKKSK